MKKIQIKYTIQLRQTLVIHPPFCYYSNAAPHTTRSLTCGYMSPSLVSPTSSLFTNQKPTKGLTEGGDLREAQVDVPQSI